MGRLEGKVAVITGATSGIGEATARLFAAEGASVVIAGRRADLGAKVAAALGPPSIFHRTDVAREAEVKALIDLARERFGRLDCLFNNAGLPAPAGGIETIDTAEMDRAMAVLFNGVVYGMKHAAPVMMRQGTGSIINTGSIAAYQGGYASSMIYSAAKAAVIQLTRCAALQLGESGVRVNSVSPGAIMTGIFAKAAGLGEEVAERSMEALVEPFSQAQPIRRAGRAEDVARAALFLASDDSSFVNGADLLVDGGMIAGRHWSVQQERWALLRERVAGAAG